MGQEDDPQLVQRQSSDADVKEETFVFSNRRRGYKQIKCHLYTITHTHTCRHGQHPPNRSPGEIDEERRARTSCSGRGQKPVSKLGAQLTGSHQSQRQKATRNSSVHLKNPFKTTTVHIYIFNICSIHVSNVRTYNNTLCNT